MNLIDFIYESNQSRDTELLKNTLLSFLEGFGIDRFMMAELTEGSQAHKEANFNLLANYPQEWLDRYFSKHYIDCDPVYKWGLQSNKPFTWAQLEERNLSKEESRVMNEAKDFNLRSGIALPVYQPMGRLIGLAFVGSETDIQCDKNTLNQFYAAAHQFVITYADLMQIESLDGVEIQLTVREYDVLSWIATGKSKAEIADTLAVSESCIKRHCENIFRKLGTNNLASTIAKAMRMGLMHPL